MKITTQILVIVIAWAIPARAEEKAVPQKIAPLPRSQISNENQESALKSLAGARKEIVTFVRAFPTTTFRIWQPDVKSEWIRVDLTARRKDEHTISFWFSAKFENDFTKVKESKLETFAVYLAGDYSDMKPGEVRAPIFLKIEELDDLCADTEAFLLAKKRERKKS